VPQGRDENVSTNFPRAASLTLAQTHYLARFPTTLHFGPKYLWNGTTHWQAQNDVISYNPSHVRRKTFGDSGGSRNCWWGM